MSTATYGCPNGSSIVLDVGYSGLTANAQIKAAVDAYCKTGRSDKAQEAANALAPCQLNACTTVVPPGAQYRVEENGMVYAQSHTTGTQVVTDNAGILYLYCGQGDSWSANPPGQNIWRCAQGATVNFVPNSTIIQPSLATYVATILFSVLVLWYILLSIAQGMREILIARGVERCGWCESYHASECSCRAMYRSTMIYLIVSFSPIYRVIVWLWRPRA